MIYLVKWQSFPGGSAGEKHTRPCRRPKRPGFNPWVGKSPWRRKWQRVLVFLPGEPHGQRSLAGYSPWGHKDSDMTEYTHAGIQTHTHSKISVKRNGWGGWMKRRRKARERGREWRRKKAENGNIFPMTQWCICFKSTHLIDTSWPSTTYQAFD